MALEVLTRVHLGTAVENPAVWVDASDQIHAALADGIPRSISAIITDLGGRLILNRTVVHPPTGANNYWPVFGNTGLITYNTDANGLLNGLSVKVNTSGVVRGPGRFDSTPSHHPNGVALELRDGRLFALFQGLVGGNWKIDSRELSPLDLAGTGPLYPVVDSPGTDSELSSTISGDVVGTCYHVDFSQIRTETRNASTWTQISNAPVPPSSGTQSFCSMAAVSSGFKTSYQVLGGGNHSLEVHSLGHDGAPLGTVVVRSPSPRAIDSSAIACSRDDSCLVTWKEQDVSGIWDLWIRRINTDSTPGNASTLLERNVTTSRVNPVAFSESNWAVAGVTTAGGKAILNIFRLLALAATTGTTLNPLTTGAIAPPPGSTTTTNAVGSSSSTIILLPPPPPIFEDTSPPPQREEDNITGIVIAAAAACITVCLGLIFWFVRGRRNEKNESNPSTAPESSRGVAEDTPSSVVVVYDQLPKGDETTSSTSGDGDETPGKIQYTSLSAFREV